MKIILIIEDHDTLRSLIAYALEMHYKVITATNGVEGLQLFEEAKPDLIITDISMPGMNGYEVIRKVRGQGSNVKIIAHSATFAHQLDMDKAYDAGADLCLAKPVTVNELENAIAQILGNSNRVN